MMATTKCQTVRVFTASLRSWLCVDFRVCLMCLGYEGVVTCLSKHQTDSISNDINQRKSANPHVIS